VSLGIVEPTLKYHPLFIWSLMAQYARHCMVGSLTGVVASKRVSEAFKGTLSTLGNRTWSAIAQGCLTVRQTSRAGTKVGDSDPVVPRGRAIAHRIKGTPGITG
jgi:Family of unknown function (DUF6467)